jgi:hypothetical protein
MGNADLLYPERCLVAEGNNVLNGLATLKALNHHNLCGNIEQPSHHRETFDLLNNK